MTGRTEFTLGDQKILARALVGCAEADRGKMVNFEMLAKEYPHHKAPSWKDHFRRTGNETVMRQIAILEKKAKKARIAKRRAAEALEKEGVQDDEVMVLSDDEEEEQDEEEVDQLAESAVEVRESKDGRPLPSGSSSKKDKSDNNSKNNNVSCKPSGSLSGKSRKQSSLGSGSAEEDEFIAEEAEDLIVALVKGRRRGMSEKEIYEKLAKAETNPHSRASWQTYHLNHRALVDDAVEVRSRISQEKRRKEHEQKERKDALEKWDREAGKIRAKKATAAPTVGITGGSMSGFTAEDDERIVFGLAQATLNDAAIESVYLTLEKQYPHHSSADWKRRHRLDLPGFAVKQGAEVVRQSSIKAAHHTEKLAEKKARLISKSSPSKALATKAMVGKSKVISTNINDDLFDSSASPPTPIATPPKPNPLPTHFHEIIVPATNAVPSRLATPKSNLNELENDGEDEDDRRILEEMMDDFLEEDAPISAIRPGTLQLLAAPARRIALPSELQLISEFTNTTSEFEAIDLKLGVERRKELAIQATNVLEMAALAEHTRQANHAVTSPTLPIIADRGSNLSDAIASTSKIQLEEAKATEMKIRRAEFEAERKRAVLEKTAAMTGRLEEDRMRRGEVVHARGSAPFVSTSPTSTTTIQTGGKRPRASIDSAQRHAHDQSQHSVPAFSLNPSKRLRDDSLETNSIDSMDSAYQPRSKKPRIHAAPRVTSLASSPHSVRSSSLASPERANLSKLFLEYAARFRCTRQQVASVFLSCSAPKDMLVLEQALTWFSPLRPAVGTFEYEELEKFVATRMWSYDNDVVVLSGSAEEKAELDQLKGKGKVRGRFAALVAAGRGSVDRLVRGWPWNGKVVKK